MATVKEAKEEDDEILP